MNLIDYLVLAVVALLVGCAAGYVYCAKKRGKKCIGCPSRSSCSGQCAGCSGGCGACKK